MRASSRSCWASFVTSCLGESVAQRLFNLVTLDGRACEDGRQVGIDNWEGVFIEALEQILDGITIIGMIVCIVELELQDY